MKNLALLALAMCSVFSPGEAQITVSTITQSQRSYYKNPANDQEGGFWFNLDAGGSSSGVGEFGLNSPYALAQEVDVGEWNWNTSYNFLFTNDGGGGYQVTISQGSSTFQTALFRPITPYTDLMLAIGNVSYPAGGGLEFNNIAIDGQAVGSIDAGPNDPTPAFAGVLVSGAGSTWSQITGTVIPMADIIAPPDGNEFQLDIIGLVPQPQDVPEPSVWALLTVGIIILCRIKRRDRIQV